MTTSTGLHTWKVPVSGRNGRIASCMLACFSGAGNIDASTVTATLLTEFKPHNVVMVGIAAGMRDKCALAEVVLTERVVAYDGRAVLEGGRVEYRPEITRLSFSIRQDLAFYLSDVSGLEQRLHRHYERMAIALPEKADAGPVAASIIPR
ncbi:phosphorylase family protein, partial [Klebsiella variicola]